MTADADSQHCTLHMYYTEAALSDMFRLIRHLYAPLARTEGERIIHHTYVGIYLPVHFYYCYQGWPYNDI